MNGIDRCVWLSIRPGNTKQSVASTTVAPSGASPLPTATIVSPEIRTSPANSPSAVTIVPFAIRVLSLTARLLGVGGRILPLGGARVIRRNDRVAASSDPGDDLRGARHRNMGPGPGPAARPLEPAVAPSRARGLGRAARPWTGRPHLRRSGHRQDRCAPAVPRHPATPVLPSVGDVRSPVHAPPARS